MDPTDDKVNFRGKAPRESNRPIRLGGEVLAPPRHICAFFNVVDVLRTHPMIIIGGILQENPFFMPPDEFLRELRERRGRGQAASSVQDRKPA